MAKQPPGPRPSPAPSSPAPSPAGEPVDPAAIRRRITELEAQVADLKPRADAFKAQKDDLGRLKAQAEEARAQAAAERERAEAAKKHLDAERQRLLEEAEAFVQAERADRLRKVSAEVAKVQSEAEKVANQTRADADAYAATTRKRAEDALSTAGGEAHRLRAEADAALAAARDEAAATQTKAREEAHAEGRRLRDDAAKKAAETIESARADAAKLLAAARAEAAQVRATAEKEKAEAEQAKLVAERRAAERVRVEEEAARNAAEAEAERIVGEARETANERLAHAAAVEADLARREAEVDAARADVRRREAELTRGLRELTHREALVTRREDDLETAEQDVLQRRTALAGAESRIGAATVARLTEERDEARAMLQESGARNLELARERDALTRTLEDAGGVDVAARTAEVERLRARVKELLVERGTMAHEEELASLRAENERLRDLAVRVADAEKRARELERAQAGVDHAIAMARDQAAREVAVANAQLERQVTETDRLAAENAAFAGEREQLRTEIAAGRRALDDARSLQLDRDWLEARVRELERTLEDRNRLARQRAKDRYGKLAELDEKPTLTGLSHPEAPESLVRLADKVRDAMAGDREQPRYYEKHTVCAWLASLAAHRMLVLQGISGTGKTSLPIAFARAVGGWCKTVPVQSGWRDKADLFGFYNTFDHRFRASDFTTAVYEANCPDLEDRPVFLILDECNLSRVEYYLADLLSELELDPRERGRKKAPGAYDERFPTRWPHLLQVSDQQDAEAPRHLLEGRYLALPPNVWIVGTANEDESTFELADKTLDRAGILQMDGRAKAERKQPLALPPCSWSGLTGAFDAAQAKWKRGSELETWVEALAPTLEQRFEIAFGNRFLDQGKRFLPVYEAAGGSIDHGVDHLLETRILRRVRRLRDPGRVSDVQALRDALVNTWRWGKDTRPSRSLALVDRVLERLGGPR